MKRLALVGLALAGAGLLAFSQGAGEDPWWRPLNPNGQSSGLTYGNTAPTHDLVPGEVFVDVDAGNVPFIRRATTWDPILVTGGGGGTADTIPVYDAAGTGLEDSTVTDDGTNVIATGTQFTAGTGLGAAGSIHLDGETGVIDFEGANVDDFEVRLEPEEATVGDTVFTIEDQQNDTVYPVISVSAGLTDVEAANAIWFGIDGGTGLGTIYFESLTPNNFEVQLTADDVTADTTVAFMDYNEFGQGAQVFPIMSNTGDVQIGQANAMWAGTNEFVFEGGTRDAFETAITVTDPTVINDITFADYGVGGVSGPAFYPVVSIVEQVEPDMGNSNWFDDNLLIWEGPTADAFEFQIGGYDYLGGADVLLVASLPAGGASGAILELDTSPDIMQAGDIVDGFLLDFTMDNDTGGTFSALRIDDVVNDAQSDYFAINIEGGFDVDIAYPDLDDLIIGDGSGALTTYIIVDDGNANDPFSFIRATTGVGVNNQLASFVAGIDIMAAGNVIDGIFLDLTNANHTGGTLNGIRIDDIVGDPQATEHAVHIEDGWDNELYFGGATAQVTGAGSTQFNSPTSVYVLNNSDSAYYHQFTTDDGTVARTTGQVVNIVGTQAAMQNADDVSYLRIDINGSPNHAAFSDLSGLSIDSLPAIDTDAFEAAIRIGEKWDASIVMEHMAAAPIDAPRTGWVSFYVDDHFDYSGAGGNDCAFVAMVFGGATIPIAILNLNAACP